MQKSLRSVSSVTSIITLLIASVATPSSARALADTGGYPWHDATLVRAATYDWGYTSCQPAMRAANTCSAHISHKQGIAYYQSDPWRYDVRNCTSFVAWRIHQVFGVAIARWGNANNWDTAAKKTGYRVDRFPAVGSIAAWEGYYGHVAYVTAVNTDGSVNVEQYNKAGTGEFSRQSRVRADNYIHIASIPATPVAVPSSPAPALALPAPVQTAVAAEVPAPTEAKQTVPPLKPLELTAEGSLPVSQEITYIPALSPLSDQVNVYAIEWQRTNSGRLEVSKSNGADGNTTWERHWQTPVPVTDRSSTFLVADANADGHLDLYILSGSSAVGTLDTTVLDGSKGFEQPIASWASGLARVSDPSSYSLADYDGNGSLDLYAIHQNENNVTIEILDGTDRFRKPLAKWQAPSKQSSKPLYVVGDHDRDGRADVYELGNQVIVLSAESNYQHAVRSWKREEISPSV